MHILGVVAKLRKAITSLGMSLCLFVASLTPVLGIEQLGSHWTNFHET